MNHKNKEKLYNHTEVHAENSLSDIILGGQDGIVNVLGVILGVAVASSDLRIVLAAGFAAVFAESISMAAVAYTSNIAARDFYLSQLEKEKREIKEVPEIERQEIRDIYIKKGFEGELLEKIVEKITSNEKVWLETMMQEELHLAPVEDLRPFKAAVIVGVSTLIGSFVPIVPFLFLEMTYAIYASVIFSALVLFAVGAIKAKMTIGHWVKSGAEIAVIGTVSALIGYMVGLLFQ